MFRYLLVSSTALIVAGSLSCATADGQAARKNRHALPNGAVAVASIDGVPTEIILTSHVNQSGPFARHNFPPVANSAATFDNFSKDRNAEFLSWYGFSASAYYYSAVSGYSCDRSRHRPSSSGTYYSSGYTRTAIPITGRGKTVTNITIPVAVTGGGKGTKFTVGLYTNGPAVHDHLHGVGGVPAQKIASASASATQSSGYCCGQVVAVSIPATTLNSGTRYWIVGGAVAICGYKITNQVVWLGEDTDYTGDARVLVQYHQYVNENGHVVTNYTSPWNEPGPDNWTEPAAEVK